MMTALRSPEGEDSEMTDVAEQIPTQHCCSAPGRNAENSLLSPPGRKQQKRVLALCNQLLALSSRYCFVFIALAEATASGSTKNQKSNKPQGHPALDAPRGLGYKKTARPPLKGAEPNGKKLMLVGWEENCLPAAA
jgi:hypothetical protein